MPADKKNLTWLCILALVFLCADCTCVGQERPESGPDEILECSVTAWGLAVAEGKVEIWDSYLYEGRPVRRVLAQGGTTGIFSVFYRVKDSMESLSDPKTCLPILFRVHFEEGGYRRIQEFRFDQEKKVITGSHGSVLAMVGPTHDPLSAILYLRATPLSESLSMKGNVSDGRKVYPVEASVIKQEQRNVMGHHLGCWIVEPKLHEVELGGLLKDRKFHTFRTWISQGKDQTPVLARGDLFFGALFIKLKERKIHGNSVRPEWSVTQE